MTLCTSWATEADLCEPCLEYDAAVDFTPFLLAASEVLYHLSGQQFPGLCDITIQPCNHRSAASSFGPSGNLMWRDSLPFTACGCLTYRDECSCSGWPMIELAPTPVTEITEITIDGQVLSSSAYELVGDFGVRRIDGDSFPCCSDDFTIAFSYGREPPQLGIQAASILACELFLSCQPDDISRKCRLPRNTISVARQGVSVILQSAENLFRATHGQPTITGIWEIDLFLRTYNRYGVTSQSVVLSPDIPEVGRRIGP